MKGPEDTRLLRIQDELHIRGTSRTSNQIILEESNYYQQSSLIYKYSYQNAWLLFNQHLTFTKHWFVDHSNSNIECWMAERIIFIINSINEMIIIVRKIGRQFVEKLTIARRTAAVKPAPAPLTSYKRKRLQQISKHINNSKNIQAAILAFTNLCQKISCPWSKGWEYRCSKHTNSFNWERYV